MLTPEEFRIEAEACLKLARETQQVYARTALLELAADYMALAEQQAAKVQKSGPLKRFPVILQHIRHA